jgi:hypothetical protein
MSSELETELPLPKPNLDGKEFGRLPAGQLANTLRILQNCQWQAEVHRDRDRTKIPESGAGMYDSPFVLEFRWHPDLSRCHGAILKLDITAASVRVSRLSVSIPAATGTFPSMSDGNRGKWRL